MNGSSCKLSVIVPIYNTSRYLRRCLDSLIQQSFEVGEYEIICVNDGSTDNSQEIIDEYAALYPQLIRNYEQRNSGVSAARNLGIKFAKGEFIAFCDSDDVVVSNGYSDILDFISTYNVDVVSFLSQTVKTLSSNDQIIKEISSDDIIYYGSGIELYGKILLTFVWNNLYRKEFILNNNICFENICISEDVLFNLDVFMKKPVALRLRKDSYRYTINESQLIGSKRTPEKMRKMIHDYMLSLEKFCYYIHTSSDDSTKNILIRHRNSQMIPFVSRVLSSDLSINELRLLINHLNDLGIVPLPHGVRYFKIVNIILLNALICKCTSYIYRLFFIPFVLPRLSRS